MTTPFRRPLRRPNMRRAVILFPSGFTLGNLFFGVFAIIAASRQQFVEAGVYVMLGGICDALDGRVARATNSGTEFGEELDSLVDAISFGLAPAMIMYFAVLNRDGWDWIFVFAFTACAVLRLARFNIEQAGTAKTYFQGLPSPAAGITLASYYWFSQSPLYDYGAIANLPWHVLLRFIMAGLSILMISNVPYPTFPRTGFRSLRAIGASVLVIGAIALLVSRRLEYFFPISLIYVAWGLVRWVFFGLFERRQPTLPYDLSEGEDDDEDEDEFGLSESRVHASKQGHRDEASRAERPRQRGRLERVEAEVAPARPDRAPRKPERAERPAAAERTTDADRARREKKKDRPKRPERSERPERPERPERAERPPRPEIAAPSPMADTASAAPSGVGAITLSQPSVELPPADDEESSIADESGELESSGSSVPSADGSPQRKRKRRRRRGERKERGPGSGEGGPAPSGDVDRSPYAAPQPSAYSPPTPDSREQGSPAPLLPPLPPVPSPNPEPFE